MECNECLESKPLTEFYRQEKYSKSRGDYVYYNPKCKKCCIKRSYELYKENPEKHRKAVMKYDSKEKVKEKKKISNEKKTERRKIS